MLILQVPSHTHTWVLIAPDKSSLQPIGPSSCTRHGWFSLPTIDQYSLLLPPVGVWTVSQFQCGGPILSEPLPIVGLVGRYLTNYLMGRVPILYRIAALISSRCRKLTLWNISTSFPVFCSCTGQVAHVLRTRTPLVIKSIATLMLPFDLHVLSLPPAFILSQDQTLHCI